MSAAPDARPPRRTRRLLALLLPPDTRDAVLADLDDLWAERAAAHGLRAAHRWYRRQAAAAAVPALAARMTAWTRAALPAVVEDVRFAAVQLRRHPGVGLLVVGTLALGIGSMASIFSVVRGTLLRPLPFAHAERLAVVTSRTAGSDEVHFLSTPDALGMVDEMASVDGVAVFSETTIGPLTGVDRPAHVKVSWVSWPTFDVLGIEAARGRTFIAEDGAGAGPDGQEPPSAAVLSHALWVRAFGADPEVLGRTVHVWGGAATVVGILPEGLTVDLPPELNVGADAEVWLSFRSDLRDWNRDADWFRVVARRAEGASLASAVREADAYTERLRADFPRHAREGTTLRLTPVVEAVRAEVRTPVLVLFGAVTLVLLVACGNAANLLLARGTVRAGEMALRSALGAGGSRLVRQLLTESAVLAGLATLLGAVLAALGVPLLRALRPPELHRLDAVSLDPVVLLVAVGLGGVATLAAGTLPALQARRVGATARLLRKRHDGGLAPRAREALVVGQVALSVVLLGGAGLLLRTFTELQAVPLGFEPDRILTVTATQTTRPPEERRAYEAELVRAASEVPGVERAGIVFPVPMNGVYERSAEVQPEVGAAGPDTWRRVYFRTVSSGYFGAMGLDLLRGRGFEPVDEEPGPVPAVVDERLARQAFGDADAVGRVLRVRGMGPDTIPARVVGVVRWTPQWDHRDTRPTAYFPRRAYLSHEVSLVARIQGDGARVAPALAAAVRRVDPRFPADLTPMSRYVGDRLARARFLVVLMQVFAGLALGLTAVGLYGVLSYTVRRQTREMGVRRALGAPRGRITTRVVGSGLALAAAGIAVGTAGALVLGRALQGQLYRVDPADPLTLAATAVAVIAVAAAASLVPALRAGGVDPAIALREE